MNEQVFSFSTNSDYPLQEVSINHENYNSFSYSSSIGNKPNNIYSLAKAFLSFAPMTHKKLQKLCYYAKAWYLAIYDRNIVEEPFEAWVHGAVQPELYQRYRDYGYSDIPQNSDISSVPEEYISFAKEVYASYGHLSGDELERLNHQERPWLEARAGYKPWETCNTVISEQTMREYYREQMT